jgi:hypothetical protein
MTGPLPDDTPVEVTDGLGATTRMTLGEVVALWRDARHFAIDNNLRRHGVWRSLGLTVRLDTGVHP